MRILIIDPNGYALDWSMRCKDAGHIVKHFIKDHPHSIHIGVGLVDVIRDFHPYLIWADLIFAADNVLYITELDNFRKANPNACVVAATQEAAELELDRVKGMGVLNKYDILTPSFREFTNYDKAIEYVKKEDKRFVSKPNGDGDKALSYVSKTPADLVYMLERWKKNSKLRSSFILQEFVAGIEMAVGGWFGPGGWNEGWCENWEFKKLMNDDLGVATGEQGTVIQYVRTSKLANELLRPLTEYLERIKYVGYVDINCIIDDEGTAWPLEFTTRCGWPTFNIQQELCTGDPAEWLLDLCQGRDGQNWQLGRPALGVVATIPDYPYSHVVKKEVVGIPVYGLKAQVMAHVHLCEIMMGEAPVQVSRATDLVPAMIKTAQHLVTAGDYLLVMADSGETVRECQKKVYRYLKRLVIPNSPMYRTDIGNRLKSEIPILQSMGYAKQIQY